LIVIVRLPETIERASDLPEKFSHAAPLYHLMLELERPSVVSMIMANEV
jgi:hypothetical protein